MEDEFGRVLVDVNTNFEFVTNFGRYPIADIMQSYVFESIFPTLEQFFSLRLQMKNHKEIIRKLLKLSFMSIAYKSKPSHEKRFQKLMGNVRNDPQLTEIMAEQGLESLLASAPQEGIIVKE